MRLAFLVLVCDGETNGKPCNAETEAEPTWDEAYRRARLAGWFVNQRRHLCPVHR